MACPYFQKKTAAARPAVNGGGDNDDDPDELNYAKYLQLDKILTAQRQQSANGGDSPAHDEMLFVVIHQTFELWFKQILFEIDSVRKIFDDAYMEERNMLTVISRLSRVNEIFKVICSQFVVLETMTPREFLDFRDYLGHASGFQSLQFRLLEIRLGVKEDLRIMHNKQHYACAFTGAERHVMERALGEKSLLVLVNGWLERTPGLEVGGFNFFGKFKCSVQALLTQMRADAEDMEDEEERRRSMEEYESSERLYHTVFTESAHQALVEKGERRLSFKATQGALMINMYCEEPRFHLPFQLLKQLMDIDSHFTKFRHNHASMVQRMLGSKMGTGGSSGYHYLRSTCGDRYKVFIDLMKMSSYLVPRDRIPPLCSQTKRSLSVHDFHDVDSAYSEGLYRLSKLHAASVNSFDGQ